MSLFWIIVLVLILANFGAGRFVPAFGAMGGGYGSWGGLLILLIVLYVLIGRGGTL